MEVAFLDRDGTITKDYKDEDWRFVSQLEFIDGSIDALINIQNKGYELIIITNQYLINENIITLNSYEKLTNKFISKLKENNIDLLDIFYCPHTRTEGCDCLKPRPGLINQALMKYPNIDLEHSFLVGDSLCDMELAQYFNLDFFGINISISYDNIRPVNSLNDVLDFI